MKKVLPSLVVILAPIFVLFSLFFLSKKAIPVLSATANHVVISEVQIAGTTSTDEFVELYNPTNEDVDINGWKLARKTAAGTEPLDLVASLSGTIQSKSYFLIASESYDGEVVPDVIYATSSGSIANNNTVLLYANQQATIVIDKLGLGSANDRETQTVANPSANKSVERKAHQGSTSESMAVGGNDEFLGNGEDSDNNNADFVPRNNPQPQNSKSPKEPVPTPTSSPTSTSTPTPTQTQTPTPSPTNTPTNIPTQTPSPTSTVTPSVTLTLTSSPTPTPTLSLSPTPTPPQNNGKIIALFPFGEKPLVCKLDYKERSTLFFTVWLPVISCSR
ncbi:MAG: lamin tail domain-containing protein [Patescibacteria group bacterium]|nr:lamin tail domain-containing protein [Patescibacteria group bacterium]